MSDYNKLTPTKNRILLQELDLDLSHSEIILSNPAENTKVYEVVAIGESNTAHTLEVGDKVILDRYPRNPIIFNETKYQLVMFSDILATVDF